MKKSFTGLRRDGGSSKMCFTVVHGQDLGGGKGKKKGKRLSTLSTLRLSRF